MSKHREALRTKVDRERTKISRNSSKAMVQRIVERETVLQNQNKDLSKAIHSKFLSTLEPEKAASAALRAGAGAAGLMPTKVLSSKIKETLLSSLQIDSLHGKNVSGLASPQNLASAKTQAPSAKNPPSGNPIHFAEKMYEEGALRSAQKARDGELLQLNPKAKAHFHILDLLKKGDSKKLPQIRSENAPADAERGRPAQGALGRLPLIEKHAALRSHEKNALNPWGRQ